jgi:guanine deaminase
MGTDVGAGTSFSMLQTMNEAYKIQQLQKEKLSAFKAFYLSTMGSAKALSLEDKVGNFAPGKEADFVVLNYSATKLQGLRTSRAKDLHDKLFAMMTLGDDRNVVATFAAGEKVFSATR